MNLILYTQTGRASLKFKNDSQWLLLLVFLLCWPASRAAETRNRVWLGSSPRCRLFGVIQVRGGSVGNLDVSAWNSEKLREVQSKLDTNKALKDASQELFDSVSKIIENKVGEDESTTASTVGEIFEYLPDIDSKDPQVANSALALIIILMDACLVYEIPRCFPIP